MRELVALIVASALVACSSGDATGGTSSARIYAPCSGEPDACLQATVRSDTEGTTHCLCEIYCKVDADCPTPATGSATPTCVPFGDVIENGHTASCSLQCDDSTPCPTGMECLSGECWAPTTN